MNAPRTSLFVAVALLATLELLPPQWHLPAGIAGWALLRWGVRDVHKSLGRPLRWLQGLICLCLLGTIFGPTDAHVLSIGVSKAGALSGTTMVVRMFAIVALTSLVSAAIPVRRWAGRIRNPAAQRVIEMVIVASNLVPVLLRALSTASSTLKQRRPGWSNLPKRLWLLAVHSSLQAAMLAENVAFDMAIAAHNAGTSLSPPDASTGLTARGVPGCRS
jgi:hypothetical protein